MRFGKLALVVLVILSHSILAYYFVDRAHTNYFPLLQSSIVSQMNSVERINAKLPEKLIVGYANWNQCDESIVKAVEEGVNVVIWFAINLGIDDIGNPAITNGPDWNCVAEKVSRIRTLPDCDNTIHLISIGGWNAPHPDLSNSVEFVYNNWNKWNRETIVRTEHNFQGFDGIDWDIEGHDDIQNSNNHFSVACLDFMGRFSQLAKRDGYIVSLAPAESYLDPVTAPAFDRSLRHEYDEWAPLLENPFPYHGRNCYAYLLARYGQSPTNEGGESVDTFDFVTVQLYEGYSHLQFRLLHEQIDPALALTDFCKTITSDWFVNFALDRDLSFSDTVNMKLKKSQLVVGLANGWAGDGKFSLVLPPDIQRSYNQLEKDSIEEDLRPRGYAFWNILDEGRTPQTMSNSAVYMAAGLNSFLHTRKLS